MSQKEEFSNRWGIILAALAMAVGAGNLWRFPRLAGEYGGTFIILWMFFLFIWSIPILLTEFSIGKKFKRSVIGSYTEFAGKKYAWMGYFITICTLGIAFYYSVVTAWSLQYLGFSIDYMIQYFNGAELKNLATQEQVTSYWENISNNNFITVGLHVFALAMAVFVLIKGVKNGLEKANKILIPSLFILLIIISVIALNMDGGEIGIKYMFGINTKYFYEPKVWIEALSQSAWSTGAGWGLIMTLSAYSRTKEDVSLNIVFSSLGNNVASILAGMAIIPSVFALSTSEAEAISYLQSGNQALTFTIIPKLFFSIPGGPVLCVVFFGAFFLAAFSSLLPMIELFIKTLTDLGFDRKKAVLSAAGCCVIFGFPSAWSLDFFNNQDWVWGVGLIISGLFIIFPTIRKGVLKVKNEMIDPDSDLKLPNIYYSASMFINIGLGVILIWWWLSRGYSSYPWFNAEGMWNIIDVYSNATVITQWALVVISGLLLNRFISEKFKIL
ncbi:sodium-dependent transporter [Marinigracilibium pacificum]|uniref:Sodium-dependent transporter n=1 Tax=Marinigracilibium pacificum TaxID=2729599 RepID=A0A848IVN7_9BACT|nr:sodium-dependent transporter [Marinigracilibium pacificum]NMM48397.1 sodium-dependent transporter [Marinigracilibium pacificum]